MRTPPSFSPRQGFIQRTAAALMLCALGGLLLIIPSVSSDLPAAQNHPLYSSWQTTREPRVPAQPGEIKLGSFTLNRPASELFLRGWNEELTDIISAVPPSPSEIKDYFSERARSRLITPDAAPQTFRDWLLLRQEGVADKLLLSSANYVHDYVNNYLSSSAREGLLGLSFIRTIEWDYQTALGNRRWQGGLSALGALRETNEDAIVWQLRGYGAEQSGVGANAGLIYRRALRNALIGANVFFDYEQHGDTDENFTRWSIGGEYRNDYLDLVANRYFSLGDAVEKDGELYYSQDGTDVQLNVNIAALRIGDVSGGLTYYRWEGDYGDADDKGLRYHLRFAPASYRLNVELELDSPDGGSLDWGGRVSYLHRFGDKRGGGRGLPSDRSFDARDYFFDGVRREYAQRIRRAGEGRDTHVQALAIAGETTLRALPATASFMLDADAATPAGSLTVLTRPLTVSLNTAAAATLELRQGEAWLATIHENTALSLYLEADGSSVYIDSGNMLLMRRSRMNRVELFDGTANVVTIDLYGTQCYFTAAADPRMVCDEGEVQVTLNDFDDLLMRYGGTSVTIIVDYPPDPAAPDSRMTISLNCDGEEARFRHRSLDGDFSGCFGDARVNPPAAAGDMVEVVSAGETITIARSGANVVISGGSYTITVTGSAGIPVNTRRVSILTPPGNTQSVTILFPTGNTRPSLTAPTLTPQVATLTLGEDGKVQLVDGGLYVEDDALDCDPDAEPIPGVTMAVIFCGDLSFAGLDAGAPYPLNGRVDRVKLVTLTLSGGSNDYEVSWSNRSANNELQTVAAEPPAAAADAGVVVLSLNAALERSGDVYVLQVTDADPRYAAALSAVQLTIQVNVFKAFTGLAPPLPPVRTRLDSNIALATISFAGALGNITYAAPVFSNNGGGTYDESSHFQVVRTDGNDRVVISLTAAIEPEVDIEITIVATDDEPGSDEDETATVAVTVRVQDPGAVTYQNTSYASAVRNSAGHYVYIRQGGQQQDLAVISGVANDGLSGLAAGQDYRYAVTSPAGFVVEAAGGTRGNRGVLRFADTANLPAAAADVEVVVEVRDSHGADDGSAGTPHLTLTLSVALVEPLAVAAGGATSLEIIGRVSVARTEVIEFSGGDGDYRFNLSPSSGVLQLGNRSGAQAMLEVNTDAVVSPPQTYRLEARPSARLDGLGLAPVTVTIAVQVLEGIGALSFPRQIFFRTRLDSAIPLLTISLQSAGAGSAIEYNAAPVYNPTGSSGDFVISGREPDSAAVTIALAASAIADPITVTIEIEAVENNSDDSLDSTITVTARFVARDPAALTYQNISYPSERFPIGIQHHLYSRQDGRQQDLAIISGIANGGDQAGLADGQDYRYVVTAPPSGFVVETDGGTRGNRGILRFADTANLPAAADDIEVVVEVRDDHGADDGSAGTPHLTLTLSIALANPLALVSAAYEHKGEVIIDTAGSPAAVATVSVADGSGIPGFTYQIVGAEPADAAALFAVDGQGVVSYNNAPYTDSRSVTVMVRASDRLGDSADFQLMLFIHAPLQVGSPPAVYVHKTHPGNFYTANPAGQPDMHLARGGGNVYFFELDSGSKTLFDMIDAGTGEIGLGTGRLADAGTYTATVSVSSARVREIDPGDGIIRRVTQSLAGVAPVVYEQEVNVINSDILFSARALTVTAYQHEFSGSLTVASAAWSPPASPLPGIRYRLSDRQPPDLPLTINAESGEVGLSEAVGQSRVVAVIAATSAVEVVGFLDISSLSLNIELSLKISLDGGRNIGVFRENISDGETMHTFSVRPGTGTGAAVEYQLAEAAANLRLEANGELKQVGSVDSAQSRTITVEAVDTHPFLRATVSAVYTVYWRDDVHAGGVVVVAGGSGITPNNRRYVLRYQNGDWFRRFGDKFQARQDHAMAALNDVFYVSGGSADGTNGNIEGNVWSSTHHFTWVQIASQSHPAYNRYAHQMVLFRGELYIIGGINSSGSYLGDVWKSSDGISWEMVPQTAGFGNLAYHSAFVHIDGRLYLVGGESAAGGMASRTVWSSADGSSWVETGGLLASQPADRETKAFSYLGGLFAVQSNGLVQVSYDNGADWEVLLPTTATPACGGDIRAAFAWQRLMYVLNRNSLCSSADGNAWSIDNTSGVLGGHDRRHYPVVVYSAGGALTISIVSQLPIYEAGQASFILTFSISGGVPPYRNIKVVNKDDEILAVSELGNNAYAASLTVVSDTIEDIAIQAYDSLLRGVSLTTFINVGRWVDIVHSEPIKRFIPAAAGEMVLTSSISLDGIYAGTNEFSFHADTPAAVTDKLMLSSDGRLVLKANAVTDGSAPTFLTVTVRVSNFSGQGDAAITVELYPPVHPDGYAIMAGGRNPSRETEARNDIWAFQAASAGNSGLPMTRLGSHAAVSRLFPGLAELNGTLYIGGGRAVAGTDLDNIYTSVDGVTWTPKNYTGEPLGRDFSMFSFENSLYIIGGFNDDVWVSSNGEGWRRVNDAAPFGSVSDAQAVVHSDGKIYLMGGLMGEFGGNQAAWVSGDGQEWIIRASLTVTIQSGEVEDNKRILINLVRAVSYLGDLYLMEAGGAHRVLVSRDDGLTWISLGRGDYNRVQAAFVQNTLMYVIASDGLWASSDGADWDKVQDISEYGNRSQYSHVAVYTPAAAITPPLNLAVQGALPAELPARFAAGQALFTVNIGGGGGGYTPAATSDDIENLAVRPSGGFYEVYVDAGTAPVAGEAVITVATGDSGGARAAVTVTVTIMTGGEVLFMGGGLLRSGEIVNGIFYSPDHGANFYPLPVTGAIFEPRRNAAAVVLSNTVYIAGGNDGRVYGGIWASGDGGQSWERLVAAGAATRTLTYRRRLGMAVHNGTMYIAGGEDASVRGAGNRVVKGDIWSSTDGRQWTQRSGRFPSRVDFALVGLNNTLYAIGGKTQGGNNGVVLQDIWASADGGDSWNPVTVTRGGSQTTAVIASLLAPRAVVHEGTIHVIGSTLTMVPGEDDKISRPLVYSSNDGQTWGEPAILPDTYESLAEHALGVHNGHIYIFSGETFVLADNAIYRSASAGAGSWSRIHLGQRAAAGSAKRTYSQRQSHVVWSVRVPLQAPSADP